MIDRVVIRGLDREKVEWFLSNAGEVIRKKKTAAEWPSQLSNDLAKIYYLYFTTRVLKLLT